MNSDVLSAQVTKGSFLFNVDGTPKVSHIYVCFADENLALTAAVHFHQRLGDVTIPILYRTVRDDLHKALTHQHPDTSALRQHLIAFPIASCECCMDEILYHGADTRLAMRIHQDYLIRETRRGQTIDDNQNLVPCKALSK